MQKKSYPARILCKVMGVGKSAFYQWVAHRDSVKPAGQLALEQKAVKLFDSHQKKWAHKG